MRCRIHHTLKTLAFISRLEDVSRPVPDQLYKPFWRIPHVLSLDVPLVAMAWLYIFTKTWRVDYHPWEAYLVLIIFSWIISITARWMDAMLLVRRNQPLNAQDQFLLRYHPFLKWFAVLLFLLGAGITIAYMSLAIYGYLLVVGVLIGGFLGLTMMTDPESNEIPYLKNCLAGLSFACGTAIFAHVYLPATNVYEMFATREFLCFVVLVILNITAIDLWKKSFNLTDEPSRVFSDMSLTLPLTLLAVAVVYFSIKDDVSATRPFYYSILISCAMLYAINRIHEKFSLETLSIMANAALLTPCIIYLAYIRTGLP